MRPWWEKERLAHAAAYFTRPKDFILPTLLLSTLDCQLSNHSPGPLVSKSWSIRIADGMGGGHLFWWGKQRLLKEQENRRCLTVRMMGLLWLVMLCVEGLLGCNGLWILGKIGWFVHECVSWYMIEKLVAEDWMLWWRLMNDTGTDLSRYSSLVLPESYWCPSVPSSKWGVSSIPASYWGYRIDQCYGDTSALCEINRLWLIMSVGVHISLANSQTIVDTSSWRLDLNLFLYTIVSGCLMLL